MTLMQVRFHDQILMRETAEEDVMECRHCGAPRYKIRKGGRWVNRRDPRTGTVRARPFFSYDDTNFAFCSKSCFAAFWDTLLRRHGNDFRDFVYWLACSGDVSEETLRDPKYLTTLKQRVLESAAAHEGRRADIA